GDFVVSRLRPYLRQIAVIHPRALLLAEGRPLALSTELYVFAPKKSGETRAFLLPFLLGEHAQAILAAAQEGGHHPRAPRTTLLALRVPEALVNARRKMGRRVMRALDDLYDATARYQTVMQG